MNYANLKHLYLSLIHFVECTLCGRWARSADPAQLTPCVPLRTLCLRGIRHPRIHTWWLTNSQRGIIRWRSRPPETETNTPSHTAGRPCPAVPSSPLRLMFCQRGLLVAQRREGEDYLIFFIASLRFIFRRCFTISTGTASLQNVARIVTISLDLSRPVVLNRRTFVLIKEETYPINDHITGSTHILDHGTTNVSNYNNF